MKRITKALRIDGVPAKIRTGKVLGRSCYSLAVMSVS